MDTPTGRLRAALPPQQAAIGIQLAHDHLGDLDSCTVHLPDGDGVDIVAVAEVRGWLENLIARARNGERL